MLFTLYKLVNPTTDRAFYIGITTLPLEARLGQHLLDARRSLTNRTATYIRDLSQPPRIEQLFQLRCTKDYALNLEARTIRHFGSENLTNEVIDRHYSEEAKEYRRVVGLANGERLREALRVIGRAINSDPEVVAKRNASHLQAVHTEEYREKQRTNKLGTTDSVEVRRRKSEAAKLRWQQHREKQQRKEE